MAGVTILFKDGSSLKLDATMAQDHSFGAEVTDNPLEDGSSVSDHISVKPYKVAINAIQSYAPIVRPDSPAIAAPTRHVAAFDRLRRAVAAREVVTVQTGLYIYEDMAFEDMGVRKSDPTYDVPISLSFKQITFAKAQTATVPKDAVGKPVSGAPATARKQVRDTRDQATKKKGKGKVPKGNLTPPQAANARSLLSTLLSGKLKI